MNDKIMVSIRCITYNHGKFIRRALDSFLMQKVNFKYEIIIHDDASTDDTADIIREYESRYPEIIKAVYQKENQYSQGKNISIFFENLMRGKYVAYCEGDDYWTCAEKLQLQVDYLEEHPECSFTFHNADIVNVDEEFQCVFLPEDMLYSHVWQNNDMVLEPYQIIELGFIPTASIVARTELVKKRVPFCKNQVCGDLPLRLFLAMHGNAYYINKTMSAYRTGNVNSVSGQAHLSKERVLKTVEGHIKILNGFNEYSNFKWSQHIEYDIARRKLRYCINYMDDHLLEAKELRKLIRSELKTKYRIRYFLKKICGEKNYALLKIIYNKIKPSK